MAESIRLTLRTLLAYLDDTLEPDQAKIIGQKIAESDVARKLIDRIQEVTHNRQLPAPAVSGAGAKVDANVIAEYLDSVLEGDKLTELEEILLKSDVLLAEVAAGHQILSMYLSQPGPVPSRTKERMSGLIPAGSAKPKPIPKHLLDDDEDDDDDDDEDGATVGAPLQARRRRQASILWILSILLVVVAGGYFIWQSLLTGLPNGEQVRATTEPATATEPAAKTDGVPSPSVPEKKEPPEKKELAPAKKEPAVEKKEPEAPPEKKEPVVEKKEPIDKLPDDRPSSERRDAGRLLTPPPTLPAALLRRAEPGVWLRVKPEENVQTTDKLLSLPGYRSKVLLDGDVELTLAGQLPELSSQFDPLLESCATTHVPPAGCDADVTLDHGRIILVNLKKEGGAKVRVRLPGEIWDLTLTDNQTVAAVELYSLYPPEVPFRAQPGASDGPLVLVNAYGLKGHVELKIRYQTFALASPSIFQWNNRSGGASAPRGFPVPAWFQETAPANTNLARDLRAALTALDRGLNQKAVEAAVLELRKDTKPASKYLAIRALGAIDAIGELVDALGDEKDPISSGQSVAVLRQWIARSTDDEIALYQLLGKKGYTAAQAETIMELLHLFSRTAREDPATYEKLIANLRHDKLAIRQLSFWHLFEMVPEGQKIPYNPVGSPAQLEEAYKQWKKLIPDGKLPPAPKQ